MSAAGRGSRATRTRRPTREASQPAGVPRWVLVLGVVLLAAACAVGGYLVNKAMAGKKDEPGSVSDEKPPPAKKTAK